MQAFRHETFTDTDEFPEPFSAQDAAAAIEQWQEDHPAWMIVAVDYQGYQGDDGRMTMRTIEAERVVGVSADGSGPS